MLDYALTAQQLAVIWALSSGASVTHAAEEAGVHRNTINNWRRNLLPFQRALSEAQYDRALLYRERLEDLFDLAVESLQAILADPKVSPSVRLKAALTIIQAATKPPEPKKQIELLFENVAAQNPPRVHKDAQPEPAATEEPPIPQSVPAAPSPCRREHPKIGRNESCPCGSGVKYKRCCLNKTAQPAARAACEKAAYEKAA